MANFNELKDTWTKFGKEQPMWAVLTSEKYMNNKNIKSFYESGQQEIDQIMSLLEEKYEIKMKNIKAVDFGCGVGRLSRGLSKYFDTVIGIDISRPMLEFAKKETLESNIEYILNQQNDLSIIETESIDFVFTRIVLQHMDPKYMYSYLDEYVRIINKDGVIFFHIPTKRKLINSIKNSLKLLFNIKPINAMEMHGISENKILHWANKMNLELIDVIPDQSISGWFGNNYIFMKKIL